MPLIVCRRIGSTSRAILRVTIMNSAKITATPRGNKAGVPTSTKFGWITISVPMNPTAQAVMRCGPTVSCRTKCPNSSMMNGMTNAMATASASGRNRSALNIIPIPTICRLVRSNTHQNRPGGRPRPVRCHKKTGARSSACIPKRISNRIPSPIVSPSSFAKLSPSGASMQNASIRRMPRNGRSGIIDYVRPVRSVRARWMCPVRNVRRSTPCHRAPDRRHPRQRRVRS